MSDVRIVSPRETVIEVDAHAVPGRPGVVTPGLQVLHDGAAASAMAAASSAVDASGSAGAAASSATAAASSAVLATQKATAAVSAATAADDAMQAASQAAADADQSRVGAAASALAASVAEQGAVAAQDGLVLARDAAAGSASSAATSASEAMLSASSAATARSGADASAATATQKATAAASSATAAATSATNAATSESAAQTARDTTLAAAILELRGTGQPGSTTETNNAPVGTYYTDTAGTAGAWRWLKTTAGTGVARWSVVHGDTGWRNVLSLLPREYWEGKPDDPFLRIKRDGDRVTIAGRIIATTQISSYSRIIDFPAGFRPCNRFVNLGVGTSTSTLVPLGNEYWGTFLTTRTALPPGASLSFEISFPTKDTFPTTLPGTPA